MKICSFFPAATEIVCSLGLEKQLVGVSFECETSPHVLDLPKVVTLRTSKSDSTSPYIVQETLLQELAPDLILTQDLCQVCASSGRDLNEILPKLIHQPHVVSLTPHNLEDVFKTILDVGHAAGVSTQAEKKVAELRQKAEAIRNKSIGLKPRKVVFMEWVDPIYPAGHWIAEMIEFAGGQDPFASKGARSKPITWEAVVRENPEIIVAAPCGYGLKESQQMVINSLNRYPGLEKLEAFKNGQIYALNANAYFVCPGPKLVGGIEALAEIFHPEHFTGVAPNQSYQKIY